MPFRRISLRPPPNIDPTKATLAYGRLGIRRLNRELQDEELLVRQRAVKTLTDYLHDHEHIVDALREGIVETLSKLLTDPDVCCRTFTTECFKIFCQHENGRLAFLKNQLLVPFKEMIKLSEEEVVRLNSHNAIELLATSPRGAAAVVENGYIPILIDCARDEVDEIKIVVLDTLNHCLSIDTKQGLDAGGIPLFTQLLSHGEPAVRSKAAQNILDLCVDPVGKQAALDCRTIPILVNLLDDGNAKVQAAASGALTFICTTTHGRYNTLNADALPHLLSLVDHENSHVRVNALKLITNLSETPEGRTILLDHLDVISAHENDENASVAKHARIAVSVITWKP